MDRVGGPSLYDNLIEPNVIVFMAVVGSYGCLDLSLIHIYVKGKRNC